MGRQIAAVKGCMYCPLNGLTERGQSDSQSICQHPSAEPKFREVAPENEQPPLDAPDWCPLRTSALIVQLSPGGK